MRHLVLSAVLSTLATTALAEEKKGSWAVDLAATPDQRLGFAYYVSDAFSLRPSLGGGFSSREGVFANVGLDLRYEFLRAKRVVPYALASVTYLHNRSSIDSGAEGPVTLQDPHSARLGGGLGVRTRLTSRLSLFAEGRLTRLTFDDLVGTTPRGRYPLEKSTRFETSLGFNLRLK